MIAIKSSVKLLPARKAKFMKEKRHLPKSNTAIQHNVKPVKDVIYPKNMTTKIYF